MAVDFGEYFPSQESLDEDSDLQLKAEVLRFLRSEGNNPQLADGIECHARYFVGSIDFPLSRLHRIVSGAPGETKHYDPKWQENVAAIKQAIKTGRTPPPLIVVDYLSRWL